MGFWKKHQEAVEFVQREVIDAAVGVIVHEKALREAVGAPLKALCERSFQHFVTEQEAKGQEHLVYDRSQDVWVQNPKERAAHKNEQSAEHKPEEALAAQDEHKQQHAGQSAPEAGAQSRAAQDQQADLYRRQMEAYQDQLNQHAQDQSNRREQALGM